MYRKRKWLISLAAACAVFFSAVGTAAAIEPVEPDIRPAATADTKSETKTEAQEENSESVRPKAEEETGDNILLNTSSNEPSADPALPGSEPPADPALPGGDPSADPTLPDGEPPADPALPGGDPSADPTLPDGEPPADPALPGGDPSADPALPGDEPSADPALPGSDPSADPALPGDEPSADPALPDGEPPADPALPDIEPLSASAPAEHTHSWITDWSFDESCHWHECGDEDCPVSGNSQKDGYAEHSYGDDGLCTECGCHELSSPRLSRAAQGAVPTYQEAYDAMTALQEQYPEGMTWTNFTPYGSNGSLGDSYIWKGGSVYGANRGVGCTAFAFILSDAAFGSLPARTMEKGSFTFEDVKVGDILRVENNSHSVIVLQKSAGGIVIAEANYNKSVHWGRVMNEAEVLAANYIITRYPEGHVSPEDPEADKVVQSGTEGSLLWSLTGAGVLTVSGSGVIPDYSLNHLPPWNGLSVSTVIIEKGVTGIGDYAFYQSSALSVYIPDGVTKIGQNAFSEAHVLSVTIPGTVGTIGDDAFFRCANLTSVTVSEGVKTIGKKAFQGCTSLAYIDFPKSITSVGSGAFMSCTKMTRVRFMPGSGTVTLEDGLFTECRDLTSVTLPQKADRISNYMFQSCTSLPSLYIPASVTQIGDLPFSACNALKYIYFGGTQAEWESMATPPLNHSLNANGTTVIYDAVFDDPFAADPNDPGDFQPGENGSEACTSHVDADNDGKCDKCGAAMPSDSPDSDGGGNDPANPGSSGNDPVNPDGSGSGSGSDHQTGSIPGTGSSGGSDSSGSSGNSSGGSGNSSGSSGDSSGGSGNSSGDSSGEPERTSVSDAFSSLNRQYEYIQKRNEPSGFTARLAYPETFSAGEEESAAAEDLSLQDQHETEPVFDELPESGQEEIQQREEQETETETEDINSAHEADGGITVPALIASAAVVLGAAFVFIRKKITSSFPEH